LVAVLLISMSIARTGCAGGDSSGLATCVRTLRWVDYSETIRLHATMVRLHLGDALAHYRLGFDEGMMGK
jgi:hypothetical protein